MKKIFTLTLFSQNGTKHDAAGIPRYGTPLRLGFAVSKRDAKNYIKTLDKQTADGMSYLALETCTPGIFTRPLETEYYKFNEEENRFEPTTEIVSPPWWLNQHWTFS